MPYRKRPTQQYRQRRSGSEARLKSQVSRRRTGAAAARSQAEVANITDLSLFLAKYLSGSNNIVLTPRNQQGYSVGKETVGGRTRYNIRLPDWETYDLPVKNPIDKYRIYRGGLWHESMHIEFTPEKAYYYGSNKHVDSAGNVTYSVTNPLGHEVMNLIEDRRIEDLGCELWKGYKGERLFKNAYFWALRDDCAELWKDLCAPLLEQVKRGAVDLDDPWVAARFGHFRHEAFLQRLLVGKIRGSAGIPVDEYLKIDEMAHFVEDRLAKLQVHKHDPRQIYRVLVYLTQKVIEDLKLTHYQPEVKEIGDTSWSKTFTEDWAKEKRKGKEDVEKGVRNYFDEIWKVEKICPVCGQHFVKQYGVRKD